MNPIITKSNAEIYQFKNNGEYATILLTIKDSTIHFVADSSFGTFAHYWGNVGSDPIEFLNKITKDYALLKFKGLEYEEFDSEAQIKYLKKIIKENNTDNEIIEDEIDEAITICEDSSCSNTFMLLLMRSDLFEKHFNSEYENVEIKKKIDSQCEGFWKYIWKPFVSSLGKENKNDDTISSPTINNPTTKKPGK